jgi:hypothetical protein
MNNFPQNKIKWDTGGFMKTLKMTNMDSLHSSWTSLLNTTKFYEFLTTEELIQSVTKQTSHWNCLNRWL